MRNFDGFWFPDTETHLAQFTPSKYQGTARSILMAAANTYGLAIDVGAHVGLWARDLSHYFPQVVCFEPDPMNAQCLRLNCPKAVVMEMALGAQAGKAYLSFQTENTGAAFISDDGMEVQMQTLDAYGLSPSIIKIDVEGFELRVLEGAEKTIRRWKPAICLEIKDNAGKYDIEKMAPIEFLRGLGYDAWFQAGGDWIGKCRA